MQEITTARGVELSLVDLVGFSNSSGGGSGSFRVRSTAPSLTLRGHAAQTRTERRSSQPEPELFGGRENRKIRRLFRALEPFHQEINDRRRVERQDLRDNQPADDRDAERAAQFGAGTGGHHQRNRGQQRRQRRHQDGPEADNASFEDGRLRIEAALAFAFEREVDDHDAVLLDDADQQNDADESDHRQRRIGDLQGEQRAKSRRWQGRDDRQWVEQALIKHAKHDIDGNQRAKDQQGLA